MIGLGSGEAASNSTALHWKRFVAATIVSFFAIIILDFLVNGVFLQGDFESTQQYWLPSEELFRRIPLGWLSMLMTIVLYGLVYLRFGGGSGPRQGLRFGLWLGAAAAIPGPLGLYALVPWPMKMILAWTMTWFVNLVLIGLVFGRLYRPRSTPGG